MNVKKRLNKIYQEKKITDPDQCLKFDFRFKNTAISIYYDSFDEKIPSITMILTLKKDTFAKTFNVSTIDTDPDSMSDVPSTLLDDIYTNNSLKDFFSLIERVLLVSDEYHITKYTEDENFSKELQRPRKKGELCPFFASIRKRTMQDIQLNALYRTLSIDEKSLKFLQGKEYTIVTTCDPSKRHTYEDEVKKVI